MHGTSHTPVTSRTRISIHAVRGRENFACQRLPLLLLWLLLLPLGGIVFALSRPGTPTEADDW
jgi:hypothetical protein